VTVDWTVVRDAGLQPEVIDHTQRKETRKKRRIILDSFLVKKRAAGFMPAG
jgi:hypothetical protein